MPYYVSVAPKFVFRATTGRKLCFSHDRPVGVSDEKEVAECDTYIPGKLNQAEPVRDETSMEAEPESKTEGEPEPSPEAEPVRDEAPKGRRGRK